MGTTRILVVDLDGTLLSSDMLHESFWSTFAQDWRAPFRAAGALVQGRAALKEVLAQGDTPNVALLPYNPEVLAYIKEWRKQGGQVVLATATTQILADRVGAHLSLFDAVYGSNATCNLKGLNKANRLTELYGRGDFVYAGDSFADVPVWQAAGGAVTVNAPQSLRQAAEKAAPDVTHIGTDTRVGRAHLKALRPHQWLKNVLIFLPMLAAHQLDLVTFGASMLAFICFSLVASGVYVLNDLLDLDADRAHPRKRKRPFASGAVPLAHGGLMAGGLIGSGLLISLAAGLNFAIVMGIYFLLTTAYSLRLKRVAVIDICVLAALYTVRIVAGGAVTGITLSVWLLALSMFFFLALAAVKRQAELVDTGINAGVSGRDYRTEDIPFIGMVALSAGMISVLITALYINSEAVQELYAAPEVLWAICVVLLYWILRAVLIAHRGEMHDDPVIFAVKDRVSYVCGALILASGFLGTLA